MAEMCFLHYTTEDLSRAVAVGCAKRGLLFKRTAYNFVSLAHDEGAVDRALEILDDVLGDAAR
jgi:glutamate-1-semialdehyde aminotransferase